MALAKKTWQDFHGHNPQIQLCCSTYKCIFLTNVAPFELKAFQQHKTNCQEILIQQRIINQTQMFLLFVLNVFYLSLCLSSGFMLSESLFLILNTQQGLNTIKHICTCISHGLLSPHLVFGDVVSHSSCFSNVMRYAAISWTDKETKSGFICAHHR